jgi:hypothetical protein
VIQRLYEGQVLTEVPGKAFPNMFLQLSADENPEMKAIARVYPDKTLAEINLAIDTIYGIQSRNVEQRMALELLMDPSVSIVTLVGQAGTGKTLLALAAGMHLVLHEHMYDRILVSRPIIPSARTSAICPATKTRSSRTGWSRSSTTSNTSSASTSPTNSGRREKAVPPALAPRSRLAAHLDRHAGTRSSHLHPWPLDLAPVHHRRRGAEPHAPRGQDRREPRRRRIQGHPHG